MAERVHLPPPVTPNQEWFRLLYERIGEGPFPIRGYSRSALPTAADWQANDFTGLIFVYDSTGTPAKILAYSDGTNWLRVDTGVAV